MVTGSTTVALADEKEVDWATILMDKTHRKTKRKMVLFMIEFPERNDSIKLNKFLIG
jgi:hypothetical protein